MSYQTEIVKALSKLGKNGTENPDSKHNTGRLIGEAFMWDMVEKYAKSRSETVWRQLAAEDIIPVKSELEPGEHELAYSPSFAIIGRVTQPVKRFSPDELAKMLRESKYKVPESTTKEMIDRAKVPTKSVATLKVVERS